MRSQALSILLCLIATGAANPARGDSKKDLLDRMDKAASAFKAMTADVEWTNHIEALNDDSKESGKVTIKKNGPGDVQGLVEFVKPDPKFITLEKQSLRIYYPKTKMSDLYELGDQADQVYQFLMIGFGTSGTSLAKDYDMKVAGKDTVKGQAVTAIRLELIPKSQRVRDNYVKKLELWIPEQGDPYPIQEKFSQPSGDYKLAVYSDLKINPVLKPDAVQLKVPPGVITERHSGK
jgi:outer membrane lipoprotein-sorting protein